MNFLSLTVVGDGSSDACLVPMLNWLINQNFPGIAYRIDFAKNLPPHKAGLGARVATALRCYPCDILVVHRDAEREDPARRVDEIQAATCNLAIPVVLAIPVKMLEAWLLFDEETIRIAADNHNGQIVLNLPAIQRVEREADPKAILFDALRDASELAGRRRSKFRVEQRRFRVAELITDFAPLRNLTSFREFENSLIGAFS